MASTPEFSHAYRGLNTAQKKAVDAVEGPVMVVAGPGTGKTQVLTLRIANILLKTQARPENILALTYTESGAHAMKKRLAGIIGSPAYKVKISTFHGFANDLIARFPEKFPEIIGGIPATEVEQITMMKELLDTGVAPHLRLYGDPYYYVDAILSSIHTLKREGVSPDAFEALLKAEEKALMLVPDLRHGQPIRPGLEPGR
jgi:DNA helicase-2/ATP-dependent DNA helicase PcrA